MIKCLSHQVYVEPIYDSDYYNPSTSLIKIPDGAKDRCDQGIIKYVGADIDPALQIGQHVIFSGYTGTTVAIDNELLIGMHYKYIKAIIDTENYKVPGLYFKARVSSDDLELNLDRILAKLVADMASFNDTRISILKLFAGYISDVYFPATYEQSTQLISKAFTQFISPSITVHKEELKTQRDEFDGER